MTFTPRRPMVVSIDDADADTLRRWYRDLNAQHQLGRNDRHLGWWIANNAVEVTVRTVTGDVISGTGAEIREKILAYHDEQDRIRKERAA